MNDVVIASDRADSRAAEKVVAHHAEMAAHVAALVGVLTDSTAGEEARRARDRLADWARTELMPHAEAEERTLYAAAAELPHLRLLVRAMVAEHRAVSGLVDALGHAATPAGAVAAAGGLKAVFDVHLQKENELLLPALVESSEVSVDAMLEGMHEVLGAEDPPPDARVGGCGGHTCRCGEAPAEGLPELDVREVPHEIRHAAVFGALDSVAPGGGLVLVAPHDPLPLLAQLEQRAPGGFETTYLERGPEAWRLQLLRCG
jgi:uncharacterized protein (DUF2249 family)